MGSKYMVPFGCISTGRGDNLNLGKNISFGGNVMLFGNSKITIGNNTMIAYGVTIHTSTHDHKIHPMFKKTINKPVKIGNHVWIGTNATILPGVIVNDYAVVGAGSVVNAHVPSGAIVVGNPAKILRFRDGADFVEDVDITELDYLSINEGFLDDDKVCKNK